MALSLVVSDDRRQGAARRELWSVIGCDFFCIFAASTNDVLKLECQLITFTVRTYL